MIESIIGVNFSDKQLVKTALTHPSLSRKGSDYERMEFLGDAVLGLIVTELLYRKFPNENEGQLTKRLAGLIRGETLMKVAQKLDLGGHIMMSDSEAASGGRDSKANLENAMEAIIGAIYLDQGMDAAKRFVHAHWLELMDNMAEPPKDAKSALQEWAQGRSLPLPDYKVIATEGPSHAPRFEISVSVEGHESAIGVGKSKRSAEQEAAAKLLLVLSTQ